MTVGETIRGLRLQAGLTQQSLATDLGVTHSLISHIEAGRRVPSVDFLRELSSRFGIPTALLLIAAVIDEDDKLPPAVRKSYDALWRAARLTVKSEE